MKIHGGGELLSAYIDGELSTQEAAAVQAHVCACPSCRGISENLRRTKSVLARAPRRAMPPGLVADIEARLTRPVMRELLMRLLPPIRRLVATATFAAAALAAVVWFTARRTTPEQAIPLEPLLAAHSRYTAEALVPASELVASNYSAQLNAFYGDSSDQE